MLHFSSTLFISPPPSPSLSFPFSFLSFFFFFLNKRRFCYRSGAGVRQRNRMSARAGCDVRAAGRPASTVNLPDCLQRKHIPLCVSFYRPLPRPPDHANSPSSSACPRTFVLSPCASHAIRYFEIRYASDQIGETRAFLSN